MLEGFPRAEGLLNAEGVSLELIAEEAGTPAFVYSAGVIRDRYKRLAGSLSGVKSRIHYSLKANANKALLEILRAEGSAVDVVSGGELMRALRAGFSPDEIIFGGVGKTADELRQAVEVGVKLINVESEAELRLLSDIASSMGKVAVVGLRVNPEVDVENAHHYIATGERGHKFGIGIGDALSIGRTALSLKGVALSGVDMHVGSQLYSFDAYRNGIARLVELARALRGDGAPIRYLDAGGGLPVPYDSEGEPDLDAYASIVTGASRELGDVELIVEPGRFIAAASGVLLTRVLYRKQAGEHTFLICDAGMTELLRPSHYSAHHAVLPVREVQARISADVVGPVCESGDFLALDRDVADVGPGDLLAVMTAGAYGYVMSSNYNSRPRVAEVMVDGRRWSVVTARESLDDLVRLEISNPQWRDV